jgi:hypothetical protein
VGASQASPRQLELLKQRDELALQFRGHYRSSGSDGDSNGYPYFIGVFDTVAAIANPGSLLLLSFCVIALVFLISAALWYFSLFSVVLLISRLDSGSYWSWVLFVAVSVVIGTVIASAISSFKSAPTVKGLGRTAHFEWGRFRFYDRALSDNVQYGKHALSIDESRADFERVGWGDPKSVRPDEDLLGNKTFEQVWFAGDHADIGGSYPENESRLSDIALGWMIDAATAIPHPIKIDRSALRLHPDPAGMQHDECKAGIPCVTRCTRKTWKLKHRALRGPKTRIHDSVRQRFEADAVLQYDRVAPYRPENVRIVDAYKKYYKNWRYSQCDCATCRQIRGLPPLSTVSSRFNESIEGAKGILKNICRRARRWGRLS